ncbi:cupin domain-containing protein [Motiliproteus sp. MSK22-1]|uniref:cupin domain-containing protein n=1 Tax=Motiliproteus sp. MSK22-1 TaxID=1897630 RepID=UPI000975D4E5|nr:cupin domain-containing protein [Motiliproteus sp. MSK22-1]
MSNAKYVTNLDAATFQSKGDGAKFEYGYSRIGTAIGLKKLGCGLFVVPPGKCAFPYHAHSSIEEMCILLEGEGTLRQNNIEQSIRAGDVIASKITEAHQIINTSDQDLRYLVISNNEPVDVVHYPDSDKILAASMVFDEPILHITRRSAGTDYYDGE